MRALLTSVAILVIVCLAAAFAAPFFVNWSSYRPQVEAAFQRLTGIPASFSGSIEIQFLPSPRLRAQSATLKLASASVSADELEIDPQLTRLLSGEVSSEGTPVGAACHSPRS